MSVGRRLSWRLSKPAQGVIRKWKGGWSWWRWRWNYWAISWRSWQAGKPVFWGFGFLRRNEQQIMICLNKQYCNCYWSTNLRRWYMTVPTINPFGIPRWYGVILTYDTIETNGWDPIFPFDSQLGEIEVMGHDSFFFTRKMALWKENKCKLHQLRSWYRRSMPWWWRILSKLSHQIDLQLRWQRACSLVARANPLPR